MYGVQELLEQGLLLACAIQLPADGGALGNLLATYAAVLAGQVCSMHQLPHMLPVSILPASVPEDHRCIMAASDSRRPQLLQWVLF